MSNRRLDWNQPYQQVVGGGVSSVRYIQDGVGFSASGEEIVTSKASSPPPAHAPASQPQSEGSGEASTAEADNPPDYERMHWTKLRGLMQERGAVYETKPLAIRWLRAYDEAEAGE